MSPPEIADIEVLAANQQDDQALDLEEWVSLAGRLLEAVGAHGELSLAFVDEVVMADLNQRFGGRPGATDVLAFGLDGESDGYASDGRASDGRESDGRESNRHDEQPLMLGDVVVCPAMAAANAARHGQSLEDEIALLVVHGILHLRGLDHEDEIEALAMEERECQLLAECRTPGEGTSRASEVPPPPSQL